MAELVDEFVRERLSFAERNFFFRTQLKLLECNLESGECLVDLLVGDFARKQRHLFALSTNRLVMMPPLWQHDVKIWNGDRFMMMSVNQSGGFIEVLFSQDSNETTPPSFLIGGVDPGHANRFIALFNLLCLGKLWGKPEQFLQEIKGTHNNAYNLPGR